MVSYTQNELLSITDFTKQISKILTDVKERSLEKVGILKNHISGSGYEDGKIMITAHDFMRCKTKEEEKKSREEYVKNYGTYISELLGVNVSGLSDVEIYEEDVEG